jgi:hypothetical protein
MTSETDLIGNKAKQRLKSRKAATPESNMQFKRHPSGNSSHFVSPVIIGLAANNGSRTTKAGNERVNGKVSSYHEAKSKNSHNDGSQTNTEDENNFYRLGTKRHIFVVDPDWQPE